MNARRTTCQSAAGQYLSFYLGKEEYAIQVPKVREIIKLQHITCVPETPAEMKGVINLRGKVIPVIDLRLRFGLPAKEHGRRTCIIVVELNCIGGLMGLIVDEAVEVLALQESDVEDIPDFGREAESSYLLGMARVKDQVKILLDIDEALAARDLSGLTALAS